MNDETERLLSGSIGVAHCAESWNALRGVGIDPLERQVFQPKNSQNPCSWRAWAVWILRNPFRLFGYWH